MNYKHSEEENLYQSFVLVMDNSPKNRIKKIKRLPSKNYLAILYTIPTSPFLNFIETIFYFLKQEVQKSLYTTKYTFLEYLNY